MNRLFAPLAGLLFLTVTLPARGQSPQAASDTATLPTMRSNAQEVVRDMVFPDKKGKAIRDVRTEEIHVLEDGAEQKLTSFRLVEGTTARSLSPGAPESAPVQLDPIREIRLVTLVFEGLDPDSKRFFRQAVKDILDSSPEPNLYYSILTIDQKLQCIQPFTADHAELLKS